jgi:hypothetical protein
MHVRKTICVPTSFHSGPNQSYLHLLRRERAGQLAGSPWPSSRPRRPQSIIGLGRCSFVLTVCEVRQDDGGNQRDDDDDD